MSKKTQSNLDRLIKDGDQFNFQNNKYTTHGEYYSQASPNFLSWLSEVEDFINLNYGENSGPYKMLQSVDRNKFKGYYASDFEAELSKIKGAVLSCKGIIPRKNSTNDSYIVSLIKNPLFWSVLVIFIGGSYKFGYDFGYSRFDKDKIELNSLNNQYRDSLKVYREMINKSKPSIFKK